MSDTHLEELIAFIIRHSAQYSEAELRTMSLTELVMIKVALELEARGQNGTD